MRLFVIGDDPALHTQLRSSVEIRWLESQVIAYNPIEQGPLAEELRAQGFDVVVLDHAWCDRGGERRSIDELKRLTVRAGFAPVIFLAEHTGDALCEAALNAGACAAVGRSQGLSDALLAAIAGAAALQSGARAQRHHSGQIAQEQRFSGARIPGYRRIRTLATGHFAELHVAESDARGELVAIKVARDVTTDSELDHAFRRLLQEHDMAQRVDPGYVVKVHDLGISDEHAYMVMEYFDAGDLRHRMRAPLRAIEALQTAQAIALGLAAVHATGVLHRDLKPANVMLRRNGGVALIDFGLAKDAALEADITDAGQIIGTPHYMSPEQGHGEAIDGRSDLYSLGVILFEMLTGHKPFVAENPMAIIYLHRKAPVPQLPEAQADLQPLLQKLLAKEPADRFESAQQAATAIAEVVAGLRAREQAA
ncbi:MAG TPA: serine/threonine-protein kinase [Steroidobacteraceae bacterium]|jgi:DNA-binding NarL/FixJ family response regulator|nr:serine/threonine-protein kinase [Steroidobacteraceae bacterium]